MSREAEPCATSAREALHAHRGEPEQLRDGLLREAALRHALAGTVDFSPFSAPRLIASTATGVLLRCQTRVPRWTVTADWDALADTEACRPPAAAAAAAAVGEGEAKEEDEDELDHCDDTDTDVAGEANAATAAAVADSEADAAAMDAARRTDPTMVALKLMAGVSDPTPGALYRNFSRTFQPLADVAPHPNLAPVFAHFVSTLPQEVAAMLPEAPRQLFGTRHNPALALVMPLYMSSLHAMIRAVEVGTARRLRWCLDVASALAHLWRHGWAHNNLKLDEIVLDSTLDRAVLLGANCGVYVEPDGHISLPVHSVLEGNQAHRAPELVRQLREAYDHRGRSHSPVVRVDLSRQDVWALGVVMHELLAGSHPYGDMYPLHGVDEVPEVATAALAAAGVPGEVVQLMQRMLSRDPAARPDSPVAAYRELVRAMQRAACPCEAEDGDWHVV